MKGGEKHECKCRKPFSNKFGLITKSFFDISLYLSPFYLLISFCYHIKAYFNTPHFTLLSSSSLLLRIRSHVYEKDINVFAHVNMSKVIFRILLVMIVALTLMSFSGENIRLGSRGDNYSIKVWL